MYCPRIIHGSKEGSKVKNQSCSPVFAPVREAFGKHKIEKKNRIIRSLERIDLFIVSTKSQMPTLGLRRN